jgi:tRNA(Ile)-lysidine synthase
MAQDLVARVEEAFSPAPPERLGVAVSGGGDSLALLHLLHELSGKTPMSLYAVTVDHGLRSEAAAEAAQVARICAGLGIPHTILRWKGWNGRGNLQGDARRARYRLITDWARAQSIEAVALGHTADDQAETVLMRLARASGVDGLSAMAPRRMSQGVKLLRPLLGVTRDALQDYLRERGIPWIEDPSNEDTGFERIRVRQALELLKPLGIDAATLGQVAFNMARAREALDWQTFLEARRIATAEPGSVRFLWKAYRILPDEIARRLLVGAIGWISGSAYPPRRAPVLGILARLKSDSGGTVEGTRIKRFGAYLWIFREYNAVKDMTCGVGELWDGHWHLHKPVFEKGLRIAALGEAGLSHCPDWRDTSRPRDLLLASPAVWSGSDLVSAPFAGRARGWRISSTRSEEEYFASLLSH